MSRSRAAAIAAEFGFEVRSNGRDFSGFEVEASYIDQTRRIRETAGDHEGLSSFIVRADTALVAWCDLAERIRELDHTLAPLFDPEAPVVIGS